MKPNYQNLGMNDIIFENRNQAYGAYVLRRDYNKSLQQAMLIMVTAVFLLGFGKYISDKYSHSYTPPVDAGIIVCPMEPIEIPPVVPPVVPPPPPPPTPNGSVNSIDDREFQVTQNDQAQDSVPTQEDLNTGNLGITNNDKGRDPTPGVPGGTGTEPIFTPPTPPTEPQVLTIAQVMPKFPGGDEALMAFLIKNTQYPAYENDLGIEGKALVRFVVNEDGSISRAEVMRSETKGFGKEALRVVGTLPKFIPGMQNDRPAKVQFILPFTFKHK